MIPLMKLVPQQDGFGCGFACLASLLDISYNEILSLVADGENKAKHHGLYCQDIVIFLRANGFVDAYFQSLKPNMKGRIYKNGTIVYIKKSKKYPAGHYLLRIDDKWMDPWVNFVDDPDVTHSKPGYRKRLPGTPIYGIFLE